MKTTFTLFVWLIAQTIFAQRQISGKIQTTDGTPLIGASIWLKGTTKGTMADANGLFNINTPYEAILVFQCVGFQKQEIVLENTQNLTIELLPDVKELNEVVVKGVHGRIISCGGCRCPSIFFGEKIQLLTYPNPSSKEVWIKPLLFIFGNSKPKNFCKSTEDEEENEDEEEWITEERESWKQFAERSNNQEWLTQRQQLANEVFGEAQSVTLVNMAGQKFYPSYHFEPDGDMRLDLKDLASGLYVVAITAPIYGGDTPMMGKVLILP